MEDIPLPKPHITWGGEDVHHLANVPEVDDEEGHNFYQNTSRNSKLHRLAKSGDCLRVKEYFANRDPEEIWNMVRKWTYISHNILIERVTKKVWKRPKQDEY